MPKLTNPTGDDLRLVSGTTVPAGETVDVTDEEFLSAGPIFAEKAAMCAVSTRTVDEKGVERSRAPRRETRGGSR